jgi:hypothetical protein
MSDGISNAGCFQPSASRVSAISASPSGAPWESCVPALFGTEADDGFAHQQGRFVRHGARFFYCAFNRVSIVTINATHNVPAVGFETFSGVISEPAFNVTVDGDTVVVIERNQFAQLQGTCQEHTS